MPIACRAGCGSRCRRGLRPRLTIALVLVATLPAVSLALVLSDRASRQRTDRAAASLRTEAEGVARSLDYLLEKTAVRSDRARPAHRACGRANPGGPRTPARATPPDRGRASKAWPSCALDGTVIAATIRARGETVPFSGAPDRLGGSELAAVALRSGTAEVSGAAIEPLRGEQAAILISAPLRARGRHSTGVPWSAPSIPPAYPRSRAGYETTCRAAWWSRTAACAWCSPRPVPALSPGKDLRGSALVSHPGAAGRTLCLRARATARRDGAVHRRRGDPRQRLARHALRAARLGAGSANAGVRCRHGLAARRADHFRVPGGGAGGEHFRPVERTRCGRAPVRPRTGPGTGAAARRRTPRGDRRVRASRHGRRAPAHILRAAARIAASGRAPARRVDPRHRVPRAGHRESHRGTQGSQCRAGAAEPRGCADGRRQSPLVHGVHGQGMARRHCATSSPSRSS